VGTEREDTAQRAPYLLATLPLQQATQPASTKHRTLADDAGPSAGSQLVLPAQGIPGFGGLHPGQFTHSAGLLRVRGAVRTVHGLLEMGGPASLPGCQEKPHAGHLSKSGDGRLQTRYQAFDSPQGNGTVRGYLAKPVGVSGKLPTVLVIHENRGLNPHIEDITRRLALDGFLAFAPDALYSMGGYPGDEDKARELFSKLDATKTLNDFLAAARALLAFPESTARVGAVGFCYGGGVVNLLATQVREREQSAHQASTQAARPHTAGLLRTSCRAANLLL
jgi:hypothetical protein